MGGGPGSGGRRKDPAWDFFDKVDADDGKVSYVCKVCKAKVSGQAPRIRAHYLKCREKTAQQTSHPISIDVDADFETEEERDGYELLESGSSHEGTSTAAVFTATNLPPVASTSSQGQVVSKTSQTKSTTLESFVVKTNKDQKGELDTLWSEFFYSNAIPFRVADSPSFKAAMAKSRPGYHPVTPQALATSLLDACVSRVDEELTKAMQASKSTYTISLDGWSSVANDPMIGAAIHTNGRCFLLFCESAEDAAKTAELCVEFAKKAIELCTEKFGRPPLALVCDSENKMVRMREILRDEYKNMVFFGCAAHYANGLGEKITCPTLTAQVIKVQKAFRAKHALSQGLLKLGGKKPQIPSDTRWGSMDDTIVSFINNHSFYMQAIVKYPDSADPQVKTIVKDNQVLMLAMEFKAQTGPVHEAIQKLQSETATLSDAAHLFLNLLMDDNLERFKAEVKKKVECLTEAHWFAYWIDPRYKGVHMSRQQKDLARACARNFQGDDNWCELLILWDIQDKETFDEEVLRTETSSKLTPAKWWTWLTTLSEDNSPVARFSNFASQLLQVPPSSAGLERMFSSMGNIWTKKRNRLKAETAEKLCKCYKFLQFKASQK